MDKKVVIGIIAIVGIIIIASAFVAFNNDPKNEVPVTKKAEEIMPNVLKILKDYSSSDADVVSYAMKTSGSPIAGAKSYASQDFVSTYYLYTILWSKYTVSVQIYVFNTAEEAKNAYSNRAIVISGSTNVQHAFDASFDWNDKNKYFDNGLECRNGMSDWWWLLQEKNVYVEISANSSMVIDKLVRELYRNIEMG